MEPELSGETVAMFLAATEELGDRADFVRFLRECLEEAAPLEVIEALTREIEADEGAGAAREFLIEQLLRNPNLAGFVALLEQLDRGGVALEADQLALVRRFSRSLLQKRPSHRCKDCGFSGHTLMWQCPSCKTWGSIRPIVRYDGDV